LDPYSYQGEWRKIAETMVANIQGFSKLEAILKEETRERLELERSLHDSQKEELVARFVEGVSGDFSNLLASLVQQSDPAKIDPAISAMDRAALKQIHEAGLNARKLVARLMAAAGLSAFHSRSVKLHELLQSVHSRCGQLNWQNTKFEFDVYTQDALIQIDPESFEEVLLNLVENAVHACTDRSDGLVSVNVESLEKGFSIIVQDNGTGIPLSDQSSVCDPFFTTREREGFGGLGLTMAKSLAEKFNGDLTVNSIPGKGTRIVMRLFNLQDEADEVALPG